MSHNVAHSYMEKTEININKHKAYKHTGTSINIKNNAAQAQHHAI